jgi:hypothetical protein
MAIASSKRWWLALKGAADGPHSEDYITAGLQSGKLQASTQACLEGSVQWMPLSSWPEFTNGHMASSAAPPLPPATAAVVEPVLTNPRLPQFANWICIYCIAIAPLIWMMEGYAMYWFDSFFDDPAYIAFEDTGNLILTVLDAPIVAMLVIGGIKLRRLRDGGATIIRVALWLRLPFAAAEQGFSLLLTGMIEQQGLEASPVAVAGMDSTIYWLNLIGILELLFDILALIWLRRRQRTLPLS